MLRQLCWRWSIALMVDLTRPAHTGLATASSTRQLLHVSALAGRILLETFDSSSYSIYDEYGIEFEEIMNVIDGIHTSNAKAEEVSFGIDAGMLDIFTFVGHQCRDPYIRRRAALQLEKSGRLEGDRLGVVGSKIIRAIIEVEEDGLVVETCYDIPETRRRRLLHGCNYTKNALLKISIVGPPYDQVLGASVEEVWLSANAEGIQTVKPSTSRPFGYPDTVFGRGRASFLEDAATGQYYNISLKTFFFPMPRV